MCLNSNISTNKKTDSPKRAGFAIARQRLHPFTEFCDQISPPGLRIPKYSVFSCDNDDDNDE